MGLLTNDNREKPVGRRFRELGGLLETLGVGWAPKNPVVYVLVPESDDFWGTMIDLVQPFVLAKQTHAKVRFLRQKTEVPADAAAVDRARLRPVAGGEAPARRLAARGRPSSSSPTSNDFSPDITVKPGERLDPAPLVWATGRLGSFASDQYVRLPPTAIRDVAANDEVEVLARYLAAHGAPARLALRRRRSSAAPQWAGAPTTTSGPRSRRPTSRPGRPGRRPTATPSTRRSCRRARSRSTTRSSSWPTSRADPRRSSS